MTEADASLEGQLLGGRYRLVRRLGQGGMGAVYEAVQEDLGRKVAIKLLHAQLADDAHAIARFRREAEAAASLGHPNIVQVTDFGRDPEHGAFLVMELLAGRSLAAAIKQEAPLDDARVSKIASQVLHALIAAHAAGIVHRDLKPDNVFLVAVPGVGEIVKLLDFGIAKLRETEGDAKLTSTGAVLGTPAYMSPEQARGRAVDVRTDLYALGVCMYEALSGRMPFRGASYNELLFAITEDTPPSIDTLREGIDPRLAGVVARAMEKDASRRFASAEDMLAALLGEASRGNRARVEDIGSAPTLASGEVAPAKPAVKAPRAVRLDLVLAIGVVGTLAAVAVFMSQRGGSEVPEHAAAEHVDVDAFVPTDAFAPADAFVDVDAFAPTDAFVELDAGSDTGTHAPARLGRVYLADFDQLAPALTVEQAINTTAVRACAGSYMPSNEYSVWRLLVASGRVRRVARLHADPMNAGVERCLMSALRGVRLPTEVPDGPYDISLSSLPGDSLAR